MPTAQPRRMRDYLGPVTNTDIWDSFTLRPDDVIVCTPPKCGTTWVLNIVMMLIHGRVVPDAGNREASPWLDAAFRDRPAVAAFLDGLTRRRCIKTHTPLDGIAFDADPAYVVVYRHPIDVHFSMRAHAANMKHKMFEDLFPDDISAGFSRFVTGPMTDSGTDDLTVASIVHHFQQAKARADRGNVQFFHYADLSRDLAGQIKRLAKIMGISLPNATFAALTEANTFASMRKVIEQSENRFGDTSPWHDAANFFASGSSNKWEGQLNTSDLDLYTDRITALVSDEDRAWLHWGDRRAPS